MPTTEETRTKQVTPDTTQDFLTQDVDLLVSQIKENLRLSGFKAKSSMKLKNRTYPYRLPSTKATSSTADNNCELCYYHHNDNHKRPPATTREEDDSSEYILELIRKGSLIKEAVRRLYENFQDYEHSDVDVEHEEEDLQDNQSQGSFTPSSSSVYRNASNRKPYLCNASMEHSFSTRDFRQNYFSKWTTTDD